MNIPIADLLTLIFLIGLVLALLGMIIYAFIDMTVYECKRHRNSLLELEKVNDLLEKSQQITSTASHNYPI